MNCAHPVYIAVFLFQVLMGETEALIEDAANNGDYVIANTSLGELRGFSAKLQDDSVVDIFLGIPFAKPPTGDLRFQEPEPMDSWSERRDALRFANQCPQRELVWYTAIKNHPEGEDCLYLNVYTPAQADENTRDASTSHNSDNSIRNQVKSQAPARIQKTQAGHAINSNPPRRRQDRLLNFRQNQLLPVVVWIHGGGYMMGAGTQSGGALLARRGVVVVTFNYRLDILGFLSMEDGVLPGNYGMMDQVQALKWVKENIASFGGDPNKVTIFGLSAGSSSVSLHTISPLSKGLFRRAIMQSGASLCPWAVSHPVSRLSSTILTRLVGAKVSCKDIWDSLKMLKCLQQVDVEMLLNATDELRHDLRMDDTLFMPRVETTFGFLPDFPLRLFAEGLDNDVSTMRGFTSDENSMFVWDPEDKGTTVQQFEDFVGSMVSSLYGIRNPGYFEDALSHLYLNESSPDPHYTRSQLISVLSDFTMIAPSLLEINFLTDGRIKRNSSRNHYLYEFNYRPEYSNQELWRGVVHGQERPFVFGIDDERFKVYVTNISEFDRTMGDKVQTWWTNFAKYGNPNGLDEDTQNHMSWKPYKEELPYLYLINNDSRLVEYNKPEVSKLYLEMAQQLDMDVDTDKDEIKDGAKTVCGSGPNAAPAATMLPAWILTLLAMGVCWYLLPR
ncbi:neuroligin-4, X-linked [Aplysia californica]|uniref:Carboxylic ester hydrolase n=1 Tax=Aplysia californica TaxID=6500 RepID=A0ABM0JHS8_APLCA|nr:neuroligin-4, X-linked [Aplysia californica]